MTVPRKDKLIHSASFGTLCLAVLATWLLPVNSAAGQQTNSILAVRIRHVGEERKPTLCLVWYTTEEGRVRAWNGIEAASREFPIAERASEQLLARVRDEARSKHFTGKMRPYGIS